jgi:DNA-binding PadR family transcriptional regulator
MHHPGGHMGGHMGHMFGPGPRWGGGRRMRRGDIRTVLLRALEEGPGHGYEIIQRLEEKTGGMWRPSPGSVYPTLQMLEDEGLVSSEPRDGKRIYTVTEAGRAEAAERASRGGPPWGEGEPPAGVRKLREAVGQLHLAARQVAHAGREDQVDRTVAIVDEARKKVYAILAED